MVTAHTLDVADPHARALVGSLNLSRDGHGLGSRVDRTIPFPCCICLPMMHSYACTALIIDGAQSHRTVCMTAYLYVAGIPDVCRTPETSVHEHIAWQIVFLNVVPILPQVVINHAM